LIVFYGISDDWEDISSSTPSDHHDAGLVTHGPNLLHHKHAIEIPIISNLQTDFKKRHGKLHLVNQGGCFAQTICDSYRLEPCTSGGALHYSTPFVLRVNNQNITHNGQIYRPRNYANIIFTTLTLHVFNPGSRGPRFRWAGQWNINSPVRDSGKLGA